MKSALLCDGKLLVVGDGDFSFTLAMVKHHRINPQQVFTSNIETENSISHHAQAAGNMASLKDSGAFVFLETDATDLHNHPVISKEKFERIVFNFPLADRHNIKKNRSLLADFFTSCRSVLAPGGRILVTLCKGQGGTPADHPVRSWHDSWQIVAMATNASFLLCEVLPFDPLEFPEYHSVGFRFQDKSFNVTGALTHVFEEGAMVESDDLNIRGVVSRDRHTYSCSSYVASHLNRNLLEEQRNPVCILRKKLMEELGKCPSVKSLNLEHEQSPIIPSHKSKVYFRNEEGNVREPTTIFESDKMVEKDWKNCENLKRMNKTQLAHGVSPDVSDLKNENLGSFENATAAFLPSDRDNVYILVKLKDSAGSDIAGVTEEGMELDCDPTEGDGASYSVSSEKSVDYQQLGTNSDARNVAECSPPIYHCRTSLLENLPDLCQGLNEREETVDTKKSPSVMNLSLSTANQSEFNEASKNSFHATPYPSIVTCGQSLLPRDITPGSSPVKHEMLILHQINDNSKLSNESETNNMSSPEECCASNNSNQSHFDHVSSQISSLLHSVNDSVSPDVSFSINSLSHKVEIDEIDESCIIGQITITKSNDINTTDPNPDSSECIGLILLARMKHYLVYVTILDLQQLVCCLCAIDDWRLLWSASDKFLNQFQSKMTNQFSLCRYHPFSLYPMKFVHDLSFWEREPGADSDEDSVIDFDVFGLYEAIRSIVGDLVANVSLMDVYEDKETKKRSRCYRLHFISSDKCLPYVTSWKMQSKIRMEVARSLGVQLR